MSSIDTKIVDFINSIKRNWLFSEQKTPEIDFSLISRLYKTAIIHPHSLQYLNNTNYCQKYLWPNRHIFFDPSFSVKNPHVAFHYVMSLAFLIVKQSEKNTEFWASYVDKSSDLATFVDIFMENIVPKLKSKSLSLLEENCVILMLINVYSFGSEINSIDSVILKYVGIDLWSDIDANRFGSYFAKFPELKRKWENLGVLSEKDGEKVGKKAYSDFFTVFRENFFQKVMDFNAETVVEQLITNLELSLSLLTDLLSQVTTRRYLRFFLLECHFMIIVRRSRFYKWAMENAEETSFVKLLDNFEHFLNFEIDDETDELLSDKDVETQHNIDLALLQRIAFKYFKDDLGELYLSTISVLEVPANLKKILAKLSGEKVNALCFKLGLVPFSSDIMKTHYLKDNDFSLDIIVNIYSKRRESIFQTINKLSLYPTETLLWNKNFLPQNTSMPYSASKPYFNKNFHLRPLALPKLNLRFLTLQDYLARNFELYRLESSYQIQEDLADVIFNLKPEVHVDILNGERSTAFMGYSRMAVPVKKITMSKLGKPNLGESKPSVVKLEIEVDLSPFKNTRNQTVFKEWEQLMQHDVLFLCDIDAELKESQKEENIKSEKIDNKMLGLKTLRGCEIVEIKDEEYRVIGGRDEEGNLIVPKGAVRTYSVELDCAQYESDVVNGKEAIYNDFNLLIRRKAKQNNFKSSLSAMISLMNDKQNAIPNWLKNAVLGKTVNKALFQPQSEIDFNDTFVDIDHLKETLAKSYRILANPADFTAKQSSGLFKIAFDEINKTATLKDSACALRRNGLKFTRAQVEAIRVGSQEGLGLIVGPPGTGKTDCAVQIINNVLMNSPNERILLVTHSNAALNDLFEKIVKTKIDEKHLLRLGYGYKNLETAQNFGKIGRINHIAKQRQLFLDKIGRLFKSIGLGDGTGYTCQHASNFFFFHIVPRWADFVEKCRENTEKSQKYDGKNEIIAENSEKIAENIEKMAEKSENSEKNAEKSENFVTENFPFKAFFESESENGEKLDISDFSKAEALYRQLTALEKSVSEFCPFETLRTLRDKGDYLVKSYSKVVAMTCTHAALKFHSFRSLGFKFSTLVMEESAQALDIETFIPLTFNADLKRVVLIGDHFQLPPVVQNAFLKATCRFDQSFFSRAILRGAPLVALDLQGRARPELAQLYAWRYPALGDIRSPLSFSGPNPALLHPFSFVHVADYQGQGESAPAPHFYQNLGEAEYVTALYMFLRLRGYPAAKIAVLAAYNGQRQLIADVVRRRCEGSARLESLFGRPAKISTVDKFQGRQSDFVLLSLVRTRAPGHLRDVRRLVVALSRARLGLYVFGRREVLEGVFELRAAAERLMRNGDKLALVGGERYGEQAGGLGGSRGERAVLVGGVEQMGAIVERETAAASEGARKRWERELGVYKGEYEKAKLAKCGEEVN